MTCFTMHDTANESSKVSKWPSFSIRFGRFIMMLRYLVCNCMWKSPVPNRQLSISIGSVTLCLLRNFCNLDIRSSNSWFVDLVCRKMVTICDQMFSIMLPLFQYSAMYLLIQSASLDSSKDIRRNHLLPFVDSFGQAKRPSMLFLFSTITWC